MFGINRCEKVLWYCCSVVNFLFMKLTFNSLYWYWIIKILILLCGHFVSSCLLRKLWNTLQYSSIFSIQPLLLSTILLRWIILVLCEYTVMNLYSEPLDTRKNWNISIIALKLVEILQYGLSQCLEALTFYPSNINTRCIHLHKSYPYCHDIHRLL